MPAYCKPFDAKPPSPTKEQAIPYATGKANGVPIGPSHLKILEIDFLKPTRLSHKAQLFNDWE